MSIIDKLREMAKERGGKCLAESCKNTHEVLRWECDKGHSWEASPIRVKLSRSWCPICSGAPKSSGRIKRKSSPRRIKRQTIVDMQEVAVKRAGSCVSEAYKDSRTKLLWECSHGHRWEATPNSIMNGSWCPNCAGNIKHTIEEMRSIADERGGKCLSFTYINNTTKLQWECGEGHLWETTPNKIKSGRWCPKCGLKKHGTSRRLTIEEMHQIAAERGGRCLSQFYINNRTKLLWECSQGHTWEAAPAGIKKGTWCPKCYVSPITKRKQEQP